MKVKIEYTRIREWSPDGTKIVGYRDEWVIGDYKSYYGMGATFEEALERFLDKAIIAGEVS